MPIAGKRSRPYSTFIMFDFLGKNKKKTETTSLDVQDHRVMDSHGMIAGNLQINGDVFFAGSLRVDGRIDGKVQVYEGGKGQLVVSQGAVINGPVTVTSAIVDGTVNGVMNVQERLECRTHAIIRGEVTYGSMHTTEGATIEARCQQRDKKAQMQTGSGPSLLATRHVKKT